jgi:hypothetical protein
MKVSINHAYFIYFQLPNELQLLIQSYFEIWERKGFIQKPKVLCPHPDLYFRYIRKCPPKILQRCWPSDSPVSFDYRRQRHFFQYRFFVHSYCTTEDHWSIEVFPQWPIKNNKIRYNVHQLFQSETVASLQRQIPLHSELLSVWLNPNLLVLHLEFIVIRSSHLVPPSRQSMVESFTDYIIQLSSYLEKKRKELK